MKTWQCTDIIPTFGTYMAAPLFPLLKKQALFCRYAYWVRSIACCLKCCIMDIRMDVFWLFSCITCCLIMSCCNPQAWLPHWLTTSTNGYETHSAVLVTGGNRQNAFLSLHICVTQHHYSNKAMNSRWGGQIHSLVMENRNQGMFSFCWHSFRMIWFPNPILHTNFSTCKLFIKTEQFSWRDLK